jgi:hypothetical protein
MELVKQVLAVEEVDGSTEVLGIPQDLVYLIDGHGCVVSVKAEDLRGQAEVLQLVGV